MSVSLKQMRYALAVAEHGHFGRAAEACAISQPALSQQILALEARCGTPLFDRLKTGISLTPFGRDFVEVARPAVKGAEAVDSLVEGLAGQPRRAVRFGLIPTVAPYLLPQIFPALLAQFPTPGFTISENRTEALLTGLHDGSLDIALIATELPAAETRWQDTPLFDDRFVLATARNEPTFEPVALSALNPDRILLLDEGHCFRDQTISACRLDATRTTRTFAATSLSTIVEFVANGQGVTLLPSIALRKEAADPRIAIHPLDDPEAGRQLRLVWRRGSPYADLFERIAEAIRSGRGGAQAPLPETVIAEDGQ